MKKQICIVILMVFVALTCHQKNSNAETLKYSDKEVKIYVLKVDNFEKNHQYVIDLVQEQNFVLDYFTEENYLSIITESKVSEKTLVKALMNSKGINCEIIKTTTEKVKQN